jgi:hypothetical protein
MEMETRQSCCGALKYLRVWKKSISKEVLYCVLEIKYFKEEETLTLNAIRE